MSKVMNNLYLDSPLEREQELSADPEYEEWSDSVGSFVEWTKDINDNFDKVFGESDEREKQP